MSLPRNNIKKIQCHGFPDCLSQGLFTKDYQTFKFIDNNFKSAMV